MEIINWHVQNIKAENDYQTVKENIFTQKSLSIDPRRRELSAPNILLPKTKLPYLVSCTSFSTQIEGQSWVK